MDLDNNMLTAAKQAVGPVGPISAAHSELEKLHALLQDELYGLGDRLQSLLTPGEPSNDEPQKGLDSPPISDVTSFLHREISRVDTAINYVRVLKNRLEL